MSEGILIAEERVWQNGRGLETKDTANGAFFWLCAFYFFYCARPEDWIPGLSYIPVSKISGICAVLGLILSVGKARRRFRDLPRESIYLVMLIAILFASAIFSSVWRGGAVRFTLEFAKVYAAWVLTFVLVNSLHRFRRVVFIQAASVAAICAIAIIKGRHVPRLNGVISGVYSNPNDLAFAIVLSLPFCLAFLLSTRSALRKSAWALAVLVMLFTLLRTASRAGFIVLIIASLVCLWHFGIKGKRLHLIFAAALVGAALIAVAGGALKERFSGLSGKGDSAAQETANESYQERRYLMLKAIEGIEEHPVLGLGANNFQVYSGKWKDVHAAYLQIAVEGGLFALLLYLMFFWRGFANLKQLRRMKSLGSEAKLLVGALHSSLFAFVVGACFAPEAYQYFPYFMVCYTAILLALAKEQEPAEVAPARSFGRSWRRMEIQAANRGSGAITPVR